METLGVRISQGVRKYSYYRRTIMAKRFTAFMMALLTAVAITACGSAPPVEKPATTTACVRALDKADTLLLLTTKIVTDISNNDKPSFDIHLNDYRETSNEY